MHCACLDLVNAQVALIGKVHSAVQRKQSTNQSIECAELDQTDCSRGAEGGEAPGEKRVSLLDREKSCDRHSFACLQLNSSWK